MRIGSKTTAFGVFFRLAARGGGTGTPPSVPPGSSFGVFFRFQVADFDLLFDFFSLCHFIFVRSYLSGLFVVWVVSVTPKGN